MARDHARMRLDIWTDEDFIALPCTSQWLYQRLLTHGGLEYCGVVEWRPKRLAQSAGDLTATDIEMFAAPLEEGNFLIIDRDCEECLVRSFVKHDGLMDKWNLAAAVARTFTAVSSKALRGVIVHELKRLKTDHPDYRGWTRTDVQRVLKRVDIDPSTAREMTLQNPTVCPNERGNE